MSKKRTLSGKNSSIKYLVLLLIYFVYMFGVSLFSLIFTFVSKNLVSLSNIKSKNINLLIDGNSITTYGIVFIVLFAIAMVFTVSIFVYHSIYSIECVSSKATLWSISFFGFIVLISFILLMCSSGKNPRLGNLLDGDDDIKKLGNTAMTIIIFTIVVYCCLIVSIANLAVSFKKYKKNNYQLVKSE